jgi:hypothetical protein
MKHLCRCHTFRLPLEGGGRNAKDLARPSQAPIQPAPGELNPMAFLVGVPYRQTAYPPPPDASSGLARPLQFAHARRWPAQTADASPSPLGCIEGLPSMQGEASTRMEPSP